MIPILTLCTLSLLFYLFFLLRIKTGLRRVFSQDILCDEIKSITLVIPFRNEEKNLGELLQSLNNLDTEGYEFEVILVNDHSDDDWTSSRTFRSDNLDLRFIDQKQGITGKKKAIEIGVSEAKGELIFVTDADCLPGRSWVKSLASMFDRNTGFVAGAVKYRSGESFFERFQALEFGGLLLAGAGLAGTGSPIICSAASMAFRKELFYKVGGFSKNEKLASGDDEFLMRAIHRLGYKVRFVLEKESVVETFPSRNLSGFADQRSRWASKSLFYEDYLLILQLVIIFLFYLSLVVSPLLILFFGTPFVVYLALAMLSKTVMEHSILRSGEGILFEKVTLSLIFQAELVQIPYIVYAAIAGVVGGFSWKGRDYTR